MKDKQEFIDAMDLQQDESGCWFVNGDVEGEIKGVVWGDVGRVCGDVGTVWDVYNVMGNVQFNVWGTINGKEWQIADDDQEEWTV